MKKRPNIILINCDDLGYGDLGCYGSTLHDTPVLDDMAKNGRMFTDFYMGSPVCSPSRGALMTGCYPPRIGFTTFNDDWVLFPGDDIGLSPDEITLPRCLKEAGYRTGIIGKWHCGDQPEFLPTKHGFDYYYGLPYSNDMAPMNKRPTMPLLPLFENESITQFQPDQSNLTDVYTEKSCQFIKNCKTQPFFLYLAHMHVHLPLYAHARHLKTSRNGDYGACISAIDASCKSILDVLKQEGLTTNTLILFTSDNGSRNDYGPSNGLLRGTKATCFEGGLRVPLIAYWPTVIKPGTCKEIISALDLFPSLIRLAGGAVPKDRKIDGVDQLDLLLGRIGKSNRESILYYFRDNLEAIRYKQWKLHLSRRPNADKPASDHDGTNKSAEKTKNILVRELYDLSQDIGETNNIYDQYPEVVTTLTKLANDARDDLGDAFTNTKGKGCRPIGKVSEARPWGPKPCASEDTRLSWAEKLGLNHPIIVALYDRDEVG